MKCERNAGLSTSTGPKYVSSENNLRFVWRRRRNRPRGEDAQAFFYWLAGRGCQLIRGSYTRRIHGQMEIYQIFHKNMNLIREGGWYFTMSAYWGNGYDLDTP